MDLFSFSSKQVDHSTTPLAERLRPKDVKDFFGQEKIMGTGGVLSQFIKQGHLPSVILWGPPGCGKTTLASILAKNVEATFIAENAIDLGAKEIKEAGREAQERKALHNRSTVLFVDEIHRLNKSQQDNLLPFVERGDFILIGATTENPSYELNSALLSRCQIVVLSRLDEKALQNILRRAIASFGCEAEALWDESAQEKLLNWSQGDGRALLNAIDICARIYFNNDAKKEHAWPLSASNLDRILGSVRPMYYDKKSDSHYDTISAFIKSIRNSDPDAALYYLARMLKGGEDPRFIARRLVILASEDVGNAEPRGLMVAVAGFQAVELVGLPEAAINLAHVTTFLASAPKSNRSYMGLRKAESEVEATGNLSIPLSLRNPNTSTLKGMGYGSDYKYSHDTTKGWSKQEFFPEGVKNKKFYEPTDRGFEKNIKQFMEWLKS